MRTNWQTIEKCDGELPARVLARLEKARGQAGDTTLPIVQVGGVVVVDARDWSDWFGSLELPQAEKGMVERIAKGVLDKWGTD
jgi:hypothetical protein